MATRLVLAGSLDALPPGCEALFPSDPFASMAWYRTVSDHALPAGIAACFAVLTQDGRPQAVVPLARQHDGGRLGSLTTPYSCVYWPSWGGAGLASSQAVGRELGRVCRAWPTVRLDAIPGEWPDLAAFIDGLRAAGLRVQRFDHFVNRYEPVAGRSWADYLADRPGALRETVRRKLKRCALETRLETFAGQPQLERGIEAFESVYRASWKQPEPFPRFNAALMREAAGCGALRLGVLWAEDRPAAAQFWIVADGRATVVKLAHDERFTPLSPGTVLTAMMVRQLLDEERVDSLDFGRGDDPYKTLWTTQRRQRIGLLLMNPRRPAGLLAIARSALSQARGRSRDLSARRARTR